MKIFPVILAVSCLATLPAWGAGSVDAGRPAASACQGCHGAASGSFYDSVRFNASALSAAFQSVSSMSQYRTLDAQTVSDIASYLGLPNGNDTDRLLDWGEDTFPLVLSPTRQQTQQIEGYTYRFYSDTGVYVATKDGSVFIYDSQTPGASIENLGSMRSFLDQMPSNR